tara:strand:- start:3712 stop:3939 length:228 start_codon:yes stop_codon:yes gene_type:complete
MTMPDHWFQRLSNEDQERYRLWATNNYKAGQYINPMWHPVVRRECERISKGNETRGDGQVVNEGKALEEDAHEED